ncbi:CAP domain-containing protein [Ephemerocybe angulata]|uniref:CAP domain-containing protein n=1 Tax=Ephemerocybe angulata TaxID=980116 RepID=A0A8H6IHG5_9AGAR|nr:CAP domain-containing protein [Tulosesus angulatus]
MPTPLTPRIIRNLEKGLGPRLRRHLPVTHAGSNTTHATASATRSNSAGATHATSSATQPTPSAATNGTHTSTSTSSADVQAYLSAHNACRKKHGAADLTWSDELASAAQKWANNCKWGHSGGAVGPYGENLSAGTNLDIAGAIKMWTDEESQYNPSNPQYSHYTQVVWKSTTQVGCAVATCNGLLGGSGADKFYVCEYNPAGNVIGKFAENVQ